MKVDVILPAGGRISGAFAATAGTEIKALIQFNGRTILEHTLDVLHATGAVAQTVVIGPQELKAHPAAQAADVILPEAESGIANIFRGLEWLHQTNKQQHAERVLIVTTDMPFLAPEMLNQFLDACPQEAVVSLPIMRRDEIEARFPGLGGRYIPLRDGAWTIGGVFLVNPIVLLKSKPYFERLYASRKSGLAMALLLGPRLITRFLCRQASVDHVRQRCEQMLGCVGATVPNCAPELAFDIDVLEEYHYAVRWLAQRQLVTSNSS